MMISTAKIWSDIFIFQNIISEKRVLINRNNFVSGREQAEAGDMEAAQAAREEEEEYQKHVEEMRKLCEGAEDE